MKKLLILSLIFIVNLYRCPKNNLEINPKYRSLESYTYEQLRLQVKYQTLAQVRRVRTEVAASQKETNSSACAPKDSKDRHARRQVGIETNCSRFFLSRLAIQGSRFKRTFYQRSQFWTGPLPCLPNKFLFSVSLIHRDPLFMQFMPHWLGVSNLCPVI